MKKDKHTKDNKCKKCGMNKKEWNKAQNHAKKHGFGIYDTKLHLFINPMNLSFIWRGLFPKRKKMYEEVKLHRDLLTIEKIYKKKFNNEDPMELGLFKKDIELFVERMIRAVEICTLKYVLNAGGGLNVLQRMNILKGKRKFVWEI